MRHFFGYLAIFLLLSHVACSNFSDDPDGIVLSDSFDVIVSVDYGRDPGVEDFLPDSRPELSGDLVSDEFTSDPGNGDESPGDAEPDIDGIGEVAADISEVDSVGDANEDIRDTGYSDSNEDADASDDPGQLDVNLPNDSTPDVSGGQIEIEGGIDSIYFGRVLPGCQDNPDTITINNTGDGNLEISSIEMQENGNGTFQLSGLPEDWPAVVEPGGSLEFGIGFFPSTTGSYSGLVAIFSSSLATPVLEVELFGDSGACESGSHQCSCACEPNDSVNSCGSSCVPCTTAVANARAVCVEAGGVFQCGFECLENFHRCGASCKADDDPNACGAECVMCFAKSNSTRACREGQCALDCRDGWGDCDLIYNTGCEESLETTLNCGGCGIECTAAPVHGYPVCGDDGCTFDCLSGYHPSGSVCAVNNIDECCGDDGPAGTCVDCRVMMNPMPPNTTGVCEGLIDFKCELVCQQGWVSTSGGVNDGCECEFQSDFDQPGNGIDEDCDGSDGRPDLAWYVSSAGSDSADGSASSPFRTIQRAVDAAEAAYLKKRVFISAGTWEENIIIDGSISLFGGFSTDGQWQWSETNVTKIRAVTSVSDRVIAIDGSNMTDTTWIAGLEIESGPETQGSAGSDVYGIKCSGCPGLRLVGLQILAHAGGDVVGEPVGTAGVDGGTGGTGGYFGTPGAPGTSGCGRTGGAGGQGGWGTTGFAGSSGLVAGAGGGIGGTGGSYGGAGAGGTGASCIDVASGGGGALTVGTVENGYWAGTAGTTGGVGCDGHGGGGGGGARGYYDGEWDEYGAGGGGGGGGGCGGAGGPGGKAGGASLGIFLDDSSGVEIRNCVIAANDAGDGGSGGIGGAGGSGGQGGPAYRGESGYFSGAGGAGGSGGQGGKGGGGAGGISFAIYVSNTEVDLPGSNILSHGLPGVGGSTQGVKNAVDGLSGAFN